MDKQMSKRKRKVEAGRPVRIILGDDPDCDRLVNEGRMGFGFYPEEAVIRAAQHRGIDPRAAIKVFRSKHESEWKMVLLPDGTYGASWLLDLID